MEYVIVGAGPAGVAACDTIRKKQPEAGITLISGEPEPPYSRMAIPYFLADDITEEGCYLKQGETYFDSLGITLKHARVEAVTPEKNSIRLDNGENLGFDRLLLASGATPVKPPIPGIDADGIYHCWTLEDARRIVELAQPQQPVVLIGAGFIGSIILEALVRRGVELTVIETGDRMVPRMMNETAGKMIKCWCLHKGVRVLTATRVTAIEELDNNLFVQLSDNETLVTRVVICATGVRSNIGFLSGSGIETEQGVLVNRYLQTNYSNIYAAGDVAQGRDFSTGDNQVQAIQPTAVEHGRIAAVNMMIPETLAHDGSLNMNVLDTLGLIATSFGQWMGVPGGEQAELVDKLNLRYINLQFNDDCLVGVTSLGHTENIGVVRGLIQGRVKLGPWKKRLMREPSRLMEAYLACSVGIN